nr:3-keto-5-aminohexanoate cleavage protein [Sphingopyxis sp.]
MQFLDDSLLPKNQDKLVITAAPYGPEWMPEDFPEDIPVTIEEQVQKAVDCYSAGATVLHMHCRGLAGHGSKRLSMFNEVIGKIRTAVPGMIIQVGGSISFAPEGEEDGAEAKWLSDEVRHMLADLMPAPEQVTIAVNSTQMNVMDLMTEEEYGPTTLANPALYHAYREMVVPAGPEWVEEHLRPDRQRHPAAFPADLHA